MKIVVAWMRFETLKNRRIWYLVILLRASRLFFFFQAEDGIRDLTVTGVQTCALPILMANGRSLIARRTTATEVGGSVCVSMTKDSRRRPWIPPFLLMSSTARMTPSDRKSTRLNSSHSQISYAVFCLKKKKTPTHTVTSLFTPSPTTYATPLSLHCRPAITTSVAASASSCHHSALRVPSQIQS